MGLVARRKFIGDNGQTYQPGQACDEALRWKYPALRACLNFGIIEDTDGAVKKHFTRPSRAAAPELRVVEDAVIPSVEPATVSATEVESWPHPPREDRLALEPQLVCPKCGKVCASDHGLKVHVARAHSV